MSFFALFRPSTSTESDDDTYGHIRTVKANLDWMAAAPMPPSAQPKPVERTGRVRKAVAPARPDSDTTAAPKAAAAGAGRGGRRRDMD